MTGPTPGPWRAAYTTYPDVWDVVTGSDSTLVTSDATEADARLIAAAPELLDCVKYLCCELEAQLDCDDETITQARHLIAKAEGREVPA